MKFFSKIIGLFLVISFSSCENEVEINAEYQDITTVFGLLDRQADTQFVRIGRTFLDNDQNAIQLAGQPDRLYYDTLGVKLIEDATNKKITLNRITLPKNSGLFTQDRNEVYYTDERPNPGKLYHLEITKPDGSITKGKSLVTNGVSILKPSAATNQPVIFIDFRGNFNNYEFTFRTNANIGEFEVQMKFKYVDIVVSDNDSTFHEIIIPMTKIQNQDLEAQTYKYRFNAFRFFDAIENTIPASLNPPKRVLLTKNIDIIVDAADGDYTLYRAVNGPIDGLSQTRTEYTNIENGIGLFASRRKTITATRINDDTKNYLIATYGDKTNNPTLYRGFTF